MILVYDGNITKLQSVLHRWTHKTMLDVEHFLFKYFKFYNELSVVDLTSLHAEYEDLRHDFERVQHVGLSKHAEWLCKDEIGNRLNEIGSIIEGAEQVGKASDI